MRAAESICITHLQVIMFYFKLDVLAEAYIIPLPAEDFLSTATAASILVGMHHTLMALCRNYKWLNRGSEYNRRLSPNTVLVLVFSCPNSSVIVWCSSTVE